AGQGAPAAAVRPARRGREGPAHGRRDAARGASRDAPRESTRRPRGRAGRACGPHSPTAARAAGPRPRPPCAGPRPARTGTGPSREGDRPMSDNTAGQAPAAPTGTAPVPDGDARDRLAGLAGEVHKGVVGQDAAVTSLVVALLCRGHVLLEGVPGVAKTLLVRSLAEALDVRMRRVQFTPDMMPGDITGSLAYDNTTSDLVFREGPVFTNLLLADEINRTPPKTQSALLEAMEERQVTVDGASRPLPDPFLVVATQNPIEFDGTYTLPEAQLDRF